ncbi:MAG: FG-GAP-like repeat-containing protein [Gemmatimonadales bacterium]
MLRGRAARATVAGALVVTAVLAGVALWIERVSSGNTPQEVRLTVPARLIDVAGVEPDLQDLARYCNELNDSDHPSLGRRPLRELQARLASLERRGGSGDWAAADLHLQLARKLLNAGDLTAALEHLDEAGRMVRELKMSEAVARSRSAAVDYARAVVHLRAAGALNCTADGDPRGCLLSGTGSYSEREHTRAAIRYLDGLLAWRPGDVRVLWLLNIAQMMQGGYPDAIPPKQRIPAEVFGEAQGAPHFTDVSRDLNVAAVNLLGGSIVDDFDNDGFLDIFTTTYDPCGSAIYYHNEGTGQFTDRSTAAGLDHQLGGFNVMQTDYDNDGLLDVFIVRGAWQFEFGRRRNSLLRNEGDGTFEDVTRRAGLAQPAYPTQAAAWADYDNDGDLDLYVGNEANEKYAAYPSQLFRNNGDGTFSDVAPQAGVTNDRMAKGVAWGDYDNDGDQDLYVSNIGPNRLYRNNGDGTFRDVAPDLHVDEPADRSFVTWFWDYDNDGWLDIYVAGYSADLSEVAADYMGRKSNGTRPRLYRNTGGYGFEDVTDAVGLGEVQLPMGANFGDIDNDGWLDFYLGTGDPEPETILPNVMYRNEAGRRFVDVTQSAGVGHLPKGHGVAFGDIDNDGDQDIYLQAGGFTHGDRAPNALFRNPGSGNHWLTVRLIGKVSNRAAIGTRLKLTIDDGDVRRAVYATVSSGGSFGASSLQQEIGLGGALVVVQLEVSWPSTGRRQIFSDVPADRFIEIEEGVDTVRVVTRRRIPLGR